MLGLSALELARIQFGFTVSFHIIFPAITIGLASYMACLEALWLWKKDPVYLQLCHFWSKIFAVNFGMGVVSGLVMAYEFGTNWSYFSAKAGTVTGPLLTYEVLTAFFLEAGFLGVCLFGWDKVGKGLHLFSTIMVALGTLISATWILVSNSWMQTPVGYKIVDGRVIPVDWLKIVFNPSVPYRFTHMVLAAFLATALFVGATAAWHLLRGNRTPAIKRMLSMAMWMILIVAPIQIVVGDQHGLNTMKYQPAKIAAIEGHWENDEDQVPLILFGLPDMQNEKTRYQIAIPHAGSLILTHSWSGKIPALKNFPAEDRPNSSVVFWTFRVMAGLGTAMLLLALFAAFERWRGRLFESRWLLQFALVMGPSGLIAILAGWFTTEIGRQPWVVYGVLRTKDAVSNHSVPLLTVSLLTFVILYFCVFGTGVFYMMKLAGHVPEDMPGHTPDVQDDQRPARPLSAAPNLGDL